ncbi:MAG: Rpn family recombination-promoting nuclease/putative transposase [Planctomycetota bacterium]
MAADNPYDTLFHFTFQHAHHAAGWIRGVLPVGLVAAFDWSTLAPAPEKLHGRALRLRVADVLFTVALRDVGHRLFLLLEGKSYDDAEVHDQILGYCVRLAEQARAASTPAALVVPILLHHGRTAWPGEPSPHPWLDGLEGPVAAALAQMQPRVAFLVDDLTRANEADLQRPGLTALAQLTLLCLRFLRGMAPTDTLAALARWAGLLRAVDRDPGPPAGTTAIEKLGWYCLCVTEVPAEELHVHIQRHLQRPEETIMSTAEKLRREGRVEGRVETLLRLLARRFGPLPATMVARVQGATGVELDVWTDRILDARSLGELFAAP